MKKASISYIITIHTNHNSNKPTSHSTIIWQNDVTHSTIGSVTHCPVAGRRERLSLFDSLRLYYLYIILSMRRNPSGSVHFRMAKQADVSPSNWTQKLQCVLLDNSAVRSVLQVITSSEYSNDINTLCCCNKQSVDLILLNIHVLIK